ncbi:MAG TPA: SGNH/GDSL hydrolase family protein [Rhizomicrobium sp.]|nr:SGNH/GDSL hydrolase family protein [Rhizomicrobium sp.]
MKIARRTVLTSGVAAGMAASAAARAQTAPAKPEPPLPPTEHQLLTDWPDLQHYREDNFRVRALPASARRVVFLGDSITREWPLFHPEFFASNGYICRGISGQTTPQMLVRLRQDVISLAPEAVHLMAGTNDIAENTGPYNPTATTNNIMSMAELARMHGIRVILASVPPALEYGWHPGREPVPKIRGLNEWIRKYASISGFAYADYTAILDNGMGGMKPGLSYDGVHPSKAGYQAMEQVAARAIGEVLA